jgi:hypothetical protein
MEYRLYFIDRTSHICDVATFDSISDEQAVQLAGRYARGQPMELWRGDRLVRRLQLAADVLRGGAGTERARLPDDR